MRDDFLKVNVHPPYGIRKADLKRLSYGTLGHIFDGIHNLADPHPDVGFDPWLFWAMHPHEILGFSLSTYIYKQEALSLDGIVFPQPIEYGNVNFPRMVSAMVNHAYDYPTFPSMAHNAKIIPRLSTGRGSLMQRMSQIPEHVHASTIASLNAPRLFSSREIRNFGEWDFLDRNTDGSSIKVYVDDIYSRFHKIG